MKARSIMLTAGLAIALAVPTVAGAKVLPAAHKAKVVHALKTARPQVLKPKVLPPVTYIDIQPDPGQSSSANSQATSSNSTSADPSTTDPSPDSSMSADDEDC